MFRFLVVLGVVAFGLLACKPAETTKSNTPDETAVAKRAIMTLNKQWETLFKNRDPAALANLFTDDCVRMPDGGATTVGRQALEAAYRQEFADIWKTEFSASIFTDQIEVAGEFAFARGTDTLSQVDNGKLKQQTGKWMATYRKQPDGSWKYFWSTYNSNQ
ncbi:MAG TPA: SgcJ/EcaC family oxidoreductase [Pyrinomonadaceae bacterium]|nr:SgcJ/EcaC family oxidoreductase [Pyrinomonadaceae bacterium]